MDKFLVIDLDMDIRTARSHFEKNIYLLKLRNLMVIYQKLLILLAWIELRFIEK